MKNEEYQNGPLLLGTTHLAFLPGWPSAALVYICSAHPPGVVVKLSLAQQDLV